MSYQKYSNDDNDDVKLDIEEEQDAKDLYV